MLLIRVPAVGSVVSVTHNSKTERLLYNLPKGRKSKAVVGWMRFTTLLYTLDRSFCGFLLWDKSEENKSIISLIALCREWDPAPHA